MCYACVHECECTYSYALVMVTVHEQSEWSSTSTTLTNRKPMIDQQNIIDIEDDWMCKEKITA